MKQFEKFRFILGSGSPRRKALLSEMGFSFEQIVKEVDESFPEDLESTKVAEYISQKKAQAFESTLKEQDILICADTVVVYGSAILGKPKDRAEGILMLQKMSNSNHVVHTGVSIWGKDKCLSFTDTSEVELSNISTQEIEYYMDHYKPFDKAGAYGIQEWLGHNFIKSIKGSYTNIMGFPTEKVYRSLVNFIS